MIYLVSIQNSQIIQVRQQSQKTTQNLSRKKEHMILSTDPVLKTEI